MFGSNNTYCVSLIEALPEKDQEPSDNDVLPSQTRHDPQKKAEEFTFGVSFGT